MQNISINIFPYTQSYVWEYAYKIMQNPISRFVQQTIHYEIKGSVLHGKAYTINCF